MKRLAEGPVDEAIKAIDRIGKKVDMVNKPHITKAAKSNVSMLSALRPVMAFTTTYQPHA